MKRLALAFLLAGTAAHAGPIDFASHKGALGVSQADGPITAYGFTGGKEAGLYGKCCNVNETGLGLARSYDNEVNAPAGSQAIVLDIAALRGNDVMMNFGSVQGGESWKVGFGNELTSAAGAYTGWTVGTASSYNFGLHGEKYAIFEAQSGDVLLGGVSYSPPVNAVAEPASIALLGVGLIAAGMARRRRATV